MSRLSKLTLIVSICFASLLMTAEFAGANYQSGRKAVLNDNYEQGVKLLKKHLSENDTAAIPTHYYLGRALLKLDPIASLKHFHKVYSKQTSMRDDALFYTGVVLHDIGRTKEASRFFNTAISVGGDYKTRAQKKMRTINIEAKPFNKPYPTPATSVSFNNVKLEKFTKAYATMSKTSFVYDTIQGSVNIVRGDSIPLYTFRSLVHQTLNNHGYSIKRSSPKTYTIAAKSARHNPDYITRFFGFKQPAVLQNALSGIIPKNNLKVLQNMGVLVTGDPKMIKTAKQIISVLQKHNDMKAIHHAPEHAQASDLSKALNEFLTGLLDRNRFAVINGPNNTVLALVPSKHHARTKSTINKMDQPLSAKLHVKVHELKHVRAKRVVKQVQQILRVLPEQIGRSNAQVVANEQRNALVVSATSKRGLQIINKTIRNIDQKNEQSFDTVRVFNLQSASANNVAQKLEDIIGSEAKIVADAGRNLIIVRTDRRTIMKQVKSTIQAIDTPKQTQSDRVYKVQNTKAVPIAEEVNRLYNDNERVTITADKQTNSLLISAPKNTYNSIIKMVKTLDSPKKQVLVDVFIAEASNDKVHKLGVEWTAEMNSSKQNKTGDVGTNFGLNSQRQSGSLFGLNTAIFEQGTQELRGLLNAYSEDSDFKIISTAHLMANENEEANLSVGEVVPLLKDSQVTDDGSLNRSFEFEDVGVELGLTPNLSSDSSVTMQLDQTIQEVIGSNTSDVGAPNRRSRKLNTTVTVPNNLTLVLGGVLSTQTSDETRGVPILSDIPGIGRLFESETQNRERRNLLIFLTPHILGTDADLRGATQKLRNKRNNRLEDNEKDTVPNR